MSGFTPNFGGGSASPSGPAGGDLAGTYPNPTVSPTAFTPYAKLDGTTPFTAPVSGVPGVSKSDFATVAQVDAASIPTWPVTDDTSGATGLIGAATAGATIGDLAQYVDTSTGVPTGAFRRLTSLPPSVLANWSIKSAADVVWDDLTVTPIGAFPTAVFTLNKPLSLGRDNSFVYLNGQRLFEENSSFTMSVDRLTITLDTSATTANQLIVSNGTATPSTGSGGPPPDLSSFVTKQGTVAFEARQLGVADTDPASLVILSQMQAAIAAATPDISGLVAQNGTTPFTAEQSGVDAVAPTSLTTLNQLNAVAALAFDEIINRTTFADLAAYIASGPTDAPGKGAVFADGSIYSLLQGGSPTVATDWVKIRDANGAGADTSRIVSDSDSPIDILPTDTAVVLFYGSPVTNLNPVFRLPMTPADGHRVDISLGVIMGQAASAGWSGTIQVTNGASVTIIDGDTPAAMTVTMGTSRPSVGLVYNDASGQWQTATPKVQQFVVEDLVATPVGAYPTSTLTLNQPLNFGQDASHIDLNGQNLYEANAGIMLSPDRLTLTTYVPVQAAGDLIVRNIVGAVGPSSSYTLPVATAAVLGGIKQGTGVVITPDGTLTVTGGGTDLFPNGVATLDPLNNGETLVAGTSYINTALKPGLGYVMPAAPTDGKPAYLAITYISAEAGGNLSLQDPVTGFIVGTLEIENGLANSTFGGSLLMRYDPTYGAWAAVTKAQAVGTGGSGGASDFPATKTLDMAGFGFTGLRVVPNIQASGVVLGVEDLGTMVMIADGGTGDVFFSPALNATTSNGAFFYLASNGYGNQPFVVHSNSPFSSPPPPFCDWAGNLLTPDASADVNGNYSYSIPATPFLQPVIKQIHLWGNGNISIK